MDIKLGTNYTRVSGSALQQGAKYLYTGVATGYDCIVTIDDIYGGASLYAFDNNTSTYSGEIDRFQPIITSPQSCGTKSYVKFKFQLIATGSYNTNTGTYTLKTPGEPIWFRAYDIDGNAASKGISEFVELGSAFTGSWVDAPTSLTAVASPIMTGGDQYKISSPTLNKANISDEGQIAFNGFIYANTANTWYIIGGSYSGGNQGDPVGTNQLTDADRLNSWSFCKADISPGIDFGDAPASYSGAAPVVPAYHLVPSVATNIKIYLGSNKPDADFDPSGNAAANVDDLNATIDDEDGISYPYFPAYSGTGPYSTTVNATNTSGSNVYLYGFIDFNGDGDFADAGETSASVSVPSTSAATLQIFTVTFTGFTYNASAANRYARFRIGTNPAQVCIPNGPASNGEVEDYRFVTAVSVTGNVWKDVNGDAVKQTTENLYTATGLYVVLLDAGNKVVETEPVVAGAYTITNLPYNTSGYKLALSNTAGIVNSTLLSATTATGYVITGENNNAVPETNGDGFIILPAATGNLTNRNFGIEQPPVAVDKTLATTGNPGGTTNFTIPAGSFVPTDADGTVSFITITAFPSKVTSVTIGSNNYTSSTWPADGVSNIPFNSGAPNIKVDPIDGNVTVSITYTATDNAAKISSESGILNIPFTAISISGNVWDDANGNITKEASEVFYTTGDLKAVLVDASDKVVQAVAVSTAGTYTITDLPYSVTGYRVVLSTVSAIAVGSTIAAASLPANYVLTGENNNGTLETAADGKIILPATTTTLANRNFGIERLPESVNRTKTFPYVTAGYGNLLTSVPLQGSDPEDSPGAASISAGGKFIITQLPPANQAVLTYNDVDITTVNYLINNYNPASLGIRHLAPLTSSVIFKYATVDAAGKADPTPATYTVTLASVLPLNGMNLSANQQGSNVKLTWEVTGERNVIRYEPEYSPDGRNFTQLGIVVSAASANGSNTYSYLHLPAITNNIIYYRVVQYKADGGTSISNQVSVRLNEKGAALVSVMPTLINDMANIRIHTATTGKTTINVVDNNGRVVMSKQVSLAAGTSTFSLDGWNLLLNGSYFVQVRSQETITLVKVIVQH